MTQPNRAPGPATIPVIELWGKLLVALQGDIGDAQMDRLASDLLVKIRDRGSRGLVIDASGVWMVDSHLCASLGRLASAARLMGARTVLCGLGPEVVMTLQEMGFDLRGIATALGLEEALELLGVRAEIIDEELDGDDHAHEGDDDEDDDRDPAGRPFTFT